MTYSLARAALTAPLFLLLSACSAQIISGGTGASSSSSSGSATSGHEGTGGAGSASAQAVSVSVGTGGASVTATSVSVAGTGGVGTTVASTGAGGAPMCSQSQEEAIWQKMVQQPIKPGQAAFLDLAGPSGMGLTLAEAQQILCQGKDEGDAFGDGTDVWAWDDNMDVTVDFTPATEKANFMTLWGPGYVGELQMTSRDGVHLYRVSVGGPQISKDSQPFQLDWNLAGGLMNPQFIAEVNELHDALVATYAPGTPADPACQTTGTCVTGTFGDVGFVYFKDVGIALWVASISAGQPVASTPNRIDVYPL